MRLKNNDITIVYAGRVLFQPGDYLEAESYGSSRSFTTTAEEVVNGEAPAIRSYGNARGDERLPICRDYRSEADALAAQLEETMFVEANQTGLLQKMVGSTVGAWQAGITSVEHSVKYVGAGDSSRVRLTTTYSFILGEFVTNSGK